MLSSLGSTRWAGGHGRCCTNTRAIPVLAGSALRSAAKAARPPAGAPTPATGKGVPRAWASGQAAGAGPWVVWRGPETFAILLRSQRACLAAGISRAAVRQPPPPGDQAVGE